MAAFSCAAALAACTPDQGYRSFDEPRLGASFDAPSGWTSYTDGGPGKPTGFTLFAQEPSVRAGDQWLSPTLTLHRVSRRFGDYPNENAWRDAVAAPDAAFAVSPATGHASTTTVSGFPANMVDQTFTVNVRDREGRPQEVAVRVQSLVVREPAAYYILEYRAATQVFQPTEEVFERARKTLKLR